MSPVDAVIHFTNQVICKFMITQGEGTIITWQILIEIECSWQRYILHLTSFELDSDFGEKPVILYQSDSARF